MIHQIDSKYEWLLLSASFAVKFGLVFVLTMEKLFLRGFVLKSIKRAWIHPKIGAGDFQNSPPFERSSFLCENHWKFLTI